ncbi:hypothetical protein CHELA40_10887 [Chelatococcus asaccharovorans]|nr:hypothetical protein CHELA40_10887 [Chelatococcus asaccharovorans]CAH1685851.1 hypothetical protein CHELA17_64713 [Chelatococcus asaccharovorans]
MTANSARRWSRSAKISSRVSGSWASKRRRISRWARRLNAGRSMATSKAAARKPKAKSMAASTFAISIIVDPWFRSEYLREIIC